jgi:hypothetical protein
LTVHGQSAVERAAAPNGLLSQRAGAGWAVVRGGIDDYLDHPPGAADVWCVIEIADSSLSLDSGPKLAAYAAAGIRQYLVADLVNDRVLLHEEPAGTSYSRTTVFVRGETVQISAGTGQVPMAVDRLLP